MTPSEALERLLSISGTSAPQPTPLFTDEPKLPVYTAKAGDESWGQGIHPDATIAQIKAAAEAIERRCLLTPGEDNATQAKYGDLENQIDPADFYCYSTAQVDDRVGEIEALRASIYWWTPVVERTSRQTRWVPREFVYLDGGDREDRRVRRESISTGAALGPAQSNDAFERGLFEVLERDAFVAAWLRQDALPRINDIDGVAGEMVERLDRYQLDCRTFDLGAESDIPAVLTLTLDRSGAGPAVTTGLAAAETYAEAAAAAILESVSYRRQARIHSMSGDLPKTEKASDITSVESRIGYWARPESLRELPAWVDAQPAVRLSELDDASVSADVAVDRLTAAGLPVLEADVTIPEVAAAGFEAVRVIVPGLLPLYIAESAKGLYSARRGAIEPLCTVPHPFA